MELAPLGQGYVTYFNMIKFVSCLTILLAIVNIWKLTENMKSHFCKASQQALLNFSVKQRDVCMQDWITVHSVVNYGGSRFDLNDRLMMVGYLLLFIILVGLYQVYLDKISLIAALKHSTASHWSVVVGSSH